MRSCRRLVNTAFGGEQGSPFLRALTAAEHFFRVGVASKTRDNRRNEVERLARALPGLGWSGVRRHLAFVRRRSRSISNTAAIPTKPAR
jgi:hypothetical protein